MDDGDVLLTCGWTKPHCVPVEDCSTCSLLHPLVYCGGESKEEAEQVVANRAGGGALSVVDAEEQNRQSYIELQERLSRVENMLSQLLQRNGLDGKL